MSPRPRVLLLNGTCLDVVDDHREWLNSLEVDVVVDQTVRNASSEQLEALCENAVGIIVPAAAPVTSELMDRAGRLRVISIAASGTDSVDLAAATSRRIVVTNALVREGSEVVADMTWGMMLAVARQIPQHDRQVRAGDLRRGMGTSPWRKTLGIVGLGNIGKAVARRAVGFEMNVLATEPFPDHEFVTQHNIELVQMNELLARSDFVSLHVRLTDQTREMIGLDEFAIMRPTAFLINSARNELVVEDALAGALERGQLAGAALDDPPSHTDGPLASMDNVVFTTHMGNRARVGVHAVFRCAVQNAVDMLIGRHSAHIVNPEVCPGTMPGSLTSP